jgi:hypothetical protein
MHIITLLTDFGVRDGYVGIMKGVIYGIAPNAHITDITHTVSPQNVMEGSLVLSRSYRYFPPGTIHLAVVDPGVGTRRRPLAGKIGEHFFVCPDNGLLTPVLDEAEQAGLPIALVHLDQPRFWLPQVSTVFHGRDIFAPTAAHLAAGVLLDALGSPLSDPQRLDLPHPQPAPGGWQGQVDSVDHFGNLCTNLKRALFAGRAPQQVQIAGRIIAGTVNTFGDRPPGELVALFGTEDDLVISLVNGSAAAETGAGVGTPVTVRLAEV